MGRKQHAALQVPDECSALPKCQRLCTGCRAAMGRWSEPGAAKQLVFDCRGKEDVETYRHLLAFVHSLGRELPQGEEPYDRLY